jgi:hypothetical protein
MPPRGGPDRIKRAKTTAAIKPTPTEPKTIL